MSLQPLTGSGLRERFRAIVRVGRHVALDERADDLDVGVQVGRDLLLGLEARQLGAGRHEVVRRRGQAEREALLEGLRALDLFVGRAQFRERHAQRALDLLPGRSGTVNTWSWYHKRAGASGTDEVWQLEGCVATPSFANFSRGQLPEIALAIMAANFRTGGADSLTNVVVV